MLTTILSAISFGFFLVATTYLIVALITIIIRGFKSNPSDSYLKTIKHYMLYSVIVIIVFLGAYLINN